MTQRFSGRKSGSSGGENCVAESNLDRGEEMIGEDNASKETAGLMVDDEIEHAGKTALCKEMEGGTRRDAWEGEEEEAEGSKM